MKKILIFIVLFVLGMPACFAKDKLIFQNGNVIEGKIDFVGDGFIKIKSKFLTQVYPRTQKINVYNDSVEKRRFIFSRKTQIYTGKILFVDQFSMTIFTNGSY